VVSVRVALYDAQGALLQAAEELSYLHGGYGGLLEALERALEYKRAGEKLQLQLEPEEAFGEYDAELVRVEPVARYGEGVAVGTEVEEDARLYTVTDVAGGKAVLDGNHPLAGMALSFGCTVVGVRAATESEIERGYADDDPAGPLITVVQ
jgi:FKBP-type peptidyl-prolyl cis-trans isomerase SlyD